MASPVSELQLASAMTAVTLCACAGPSPALPSPGNATRAPEGLAFTALCGLHLARALARIKKGLAPSLHSQKLSPPLSPDLMHFPKGRWTGRQSLRPLPKTFKVVGGGDQTQVPSRICSFSISPQAFLLPVQVN